MAIGIIGAMEKEITVLRNDMNVEKTFKKANMTFYIGKLYDKEAVLVKSGVGKVNASICTQILIDKFDVDYVVNTGIAGGVKEDIAPGDIVISTDLLYHDFDTSIFGDKIGQIPDMDVYSFKADSKLIDIAYNMAEHVSEFKVYKGRIISGDQFIASADKIVHFRNFFDAYAVEMEGTAIAHTCFLNNVKFVIIRSISDRADGNAHMDYEEFQGIAIKNSVNIIMLNSIEKVD